MTDANLSQRFSALRAEMTLADLDALLVPMADEYQSEYVPPSAQRIGFLSGFSGSAGYIIVTQSKAVFFTDSRYILQAGQQISKDFFVVFDSAEKTPLAWLEDNLAKDCRVGFDPWLHSTESIERLKGVLAKIGAEAKPTKTNLIDAIWSNRPTPPAEPVVAYDLIYAGVSSDQKRQDVAAELKKKKSAAAVICDPTSIAWLLNVRGTDVANNPVPLSRAVLYDDGRVEWFLDPRKVTADLKAHVGDQVSLRDPDQFSNALTRLASLGRAISIDPAHAAMWIVEHLRKADATIEFVEDPCALPRATKNMVELDGIRAAHRRDGAALSRFLAWFDQHWAHEKLSELVVEQKLASFREANTGYRGPSFDTISGAGEHGAIVHYRATQASNASLKAGDLFLLDSGGQYLDGTTDVTRTLALGDPTPEMRDRFTRVLKGHIALAAIRFPEGTTGSELDVLARQYLWEVGLDYGHGTGHGVGCYLSVHEGPQAISKRNKVVLKPGMVLSNEPGFYKANHFGIRIENLQTVTEIAGLVAEKKMLGFETLTLVPIDRKLIDVGLLTAREITWINDYHGRVHNVLRPMVDDFTSLWLDAATLPIE